MFNETPEEYSEDTGPGPENVEPVERFTGNRSRSDDPEIELWEGGYSPKAMLGSWLGAALISVAALVVAAIFFRDQLAGIGWAILLGVIVLGWLILLAKLGYQRLSVHYRLTSQRFVHEKGVLSRVTDRIEVIDMDDIAFRQGLVDRFIGVGTIEITSSDRTHPKISIQGIDDVKNVAHLMDDARRKERIRRGLHIEAV